MYDNYFVYSWPACQIAKLMHFLQNNIITYFMIGVRFLQSPWRRLTIHKMYLFLYSIDKIHCLFLIIHFIY